MKTCPVCKRDYEDDSLFFCLEDGTSLSSVSTQSGSNQRYAYPPPTEILPPGSISPGPPSLKLPLTHPQQKTTNQTFANSNRGIWILVGGILAGIMVLLIGVASYFAWRASRPSVTEPTQAQPLTSSTTSTSSTPTESKVQTQPVAAPTTEANDTFNWLDGVWEGEGYQTDTNSTWSVRLTIAENNFAIEYPNIPCSGSWKVVDQNSGGGTFTEIITNGKSLCANNSRILLQKVSDRELSLKYSHENTRAVIATATLSKKAQTH